MPRDTEADVVAAVTGIVVVTVRRAAVEGEAKPAAAAQYEVRAILPNARPRRVRRGARGVTSLPIITPLPHIA